MIFISFLIYIESFVSLKTLEKTKTEKKTNKYLKPDILRRFQTFFTEKPYIFVIVKELGDKRAKKRVINIIRDSKKTAINNTQCARCFGASDLQIN